MESTAYVGQDEENTTPTTAKVTTATTKKAPAVVETYIPSTGSAAVVPAIVLLALSAGTVAVVKTKKDN